MKLIKCESRRLHPGGQLVKRSLEITAYCVLLTSALASPCFSQDGKIVTTGSTTRTTSAHTAAINGERSRKLQILSTIQKKGDSYHDAEPELLAFLKDADPDIQAKAAGCLLSIQPGQDDASRTLIKLLRHRDPSVRLAAIQAVGTAKSGALSVLPELIITLQGDISPKVRNQAAWAIGQFGAKGKEAIPTVLDALKQNHPLEDFHGGRDLKTLDDTIHKTCVVTLGQIGYGSSTACNALAAILSDANKEPLQEAAMKALYSLGTGATSVVPILAEQMSNEQPPKKLALIKLLKRIGATAGDAVPKLKDCMKSNDPAVRRAALDAILTISSNEKEKQDLLLTESSDSDAGVKGVASEALASSTAVSPENLKAAIDLAEHGKPEERTANLKTLSTYGPIAAVALPMLIKTYVTTTVAPAQRKIAFDTIKKLDPTGHKIIPLLKENLNDPFKSRASIELLEFIGGSTCDKLVQENKDKWHMGRTIK
jgi:HEAT repeat protein